MDERQRHNMTVSLLENLKTFLARLFSDFGKIMKIHTWDVRVQNPTIIPDQIDVRPELNDIVNAVKEIPEPKDIDLSPVVDAVNSIPKTEIPAYPTEIVVSNQPDMKSVSDSIVEAITAIPKADPIDLSRLESIVADKTSNVKEMKDVVNLLKMVLEAINKEKPEEPKEEEPISEKIEYYPDGTYKKSITTYPSKVCIETRIPGNKSDTYTYEEKNAKTK